MDIGKHIIARALADGDATPFIDAGLDISWTRREESALLLADQALHAWQFILRHQQKHGRVPSRELFEREHPPQGFRLPADPLAVSELTELAVDHLRRETITLMQIGIQGILTDPDMAQGAADLTEQAAGLVRDAAGQLDAVASASGRYRTATLGELTSLPEPEALIEGALDAGTVCLLSGPSGKGKSFVALDWSLSVASGGRWLDRRTREGSVIYVAAEGYRGLGVRAKSWQKEFGDVPEGAITFVTEPVQLGDEGTAWLAGLIRQKNADLLVIDTLARCAVGTEENSATETGLIVSRLYKLRDAIEEAGTTVLVVHHSGYDGRRARGSSALVAGVDCVTDIEGDDPHQHITLKNSKRKDDDPFPPVTLKLVTSGRSCVLEECDLTVDGPDLKGLLDDRTGQTVQELSAQLGISRQAADRHLKKLELSRSARREQSGKRLLWYRE